MSDINEETQLWREHRQRQQERHCRMHAHNRALIVASGLPFESKGETLLFRQPGRVKVDFYPSTGRWKVGTQMHSGGAAAFLIWYEKH